MSSEPQTNQPSRATNRAQRTAQRVGEQRRGTSGATSAPNAAKAAHKEQRAALTGQVEHLKRLDERLRLVVPDVDVAVVERGEHPRLARVNVDRLDAH